MRGRRVQERYVGPCCNAGLELSGYPPFHYLRSLAQWQVGDRTEARASLVRAERFAIQAQTKRRYARMAEAIAANEVPGTVAVGGPVPTGS